MSDSLGRLFVYGPGGQKDPAPPRAEGIPGYESAPEPRTYTTTYVRTDEGGGYVKTCPDCGCLVGDTKVHDRKCSKDT